MSITRERADAACVNLTRRDNLREAELAAAQAIRRSRFPRVRSKNERVTHSKDTLTCFHERSYTMACKQCGRTDKDATQFIAQLKIKLKL